MKELLGLDAPGPVGDDNHSMGAGQVVAQGPGSVSGALGVRAGQQLLGKVAPQAQLYLAQGLQVRKPQRQHGIAVFQGDPLGVPGGSVRIHEGDDTQHLVALQGERYQATSVAHRTPRLEDVLTTSGGRFGVRVRLAGTSPGGEVAVTIRDGDRQSGQLMHRPGRCQLSLPQRRPLR